MESYLKVRAERWLNLTSYVFGKWNITLLFDETGKTIRMDKATGRPLIKPVERVVVNATHPHRQYFEQVSMISHGTIGPYPVDFTGEEKLLPINDGPLPFHVFVTS